MYSSFLHNSGSILVSFQLDVDYAIEVETLIARL